MRTDLCTPKPLHRELPATEVDREFSGGRDKCRGDAQQEALEGELRLIVALLQGLLIEAG